MILKIFDRLIVQRIFDIIPFLDKLAFTEANSLDIHDTTILWSLRPTVIFAAIYSVPKLDIFYIGSDVFHISPPRDKCWGYETERCQIGFQFTSWVQFCVYQFALI